MGKSTLMTRITLHMARASLGEEDPTLPDPLTPPRIPILLSLGRYARERRSISYLSLLDYLKVIVGKLDIPDLDSFLVKCLRDGRCLVMLDGLDEASVDDPGIREQVQGEIKAFIRRLPGNRFLITSRVAGYDQAAFPDYTHYLVANLTPEQIEDFLPRWCRANVLKRRGLTSTLSGAQEESVAAESARLTQDLRAAIRDNQGVQQLAENPLLLTLLAVMQQNSIQLPQRRVELYDVVTRTLLEHRNRLSELPWIPEVQAVRYLGPLAFRMQETGNSFARRNEVITTLAEVIKQEEGGTPDQVAQQVESFLNRLRERGGIFVLRAGDYFGFFHRTFQEYFAARYILNEIKQNAAYWIPELVKMARRSDDLWREPFLLAVAYQSGEDETVAQQIIGKLLDALQGAELEIRTHDLLLATEGLFEAKPLTIGRTLESKIAEQLLQTYAEAQRTQQFQICDRIEAVVRRWLLNLPAEAYRPALLVTLEQTIRNTGHIPLQCATLTLLTMIAQQLTNCPSIVFDTLIPPLLALSGLPEVGIYKPAPGLSMTSNFDVADLALTTLSFLGQRGPAGLGLAEVRQYFRDHPEQLRLLARYSLESNTLLTLAVVPLAGENYRRYESAVGDWIKLRGRHNAGRVTEQEVERCISIHQTLLDCAEEVCYPSHVHLLKMLQAAADHPHQPWQQIWQTYLSNQLKSGKYINYQEVTLLWVMLFPELPVQRPLAELLLDDYNNDGSLVQHYAQRFVATLSNDLRDLLHPRDLLSPPNLGDLGYRRDPGYLRYLGALRYRRNLRNLGNLRYLRSLRDLGYLGDMRNLGDLGYLRELLLTQKVAEKAKTSLPAADPAQSLDLLTILLGRILQVQVADESGNNIEHEVRQIAQVACTGLASASDEEVREAMLDILRYLPACSENEIKYVLQLAEDATDKRMQQACLYALRYANPKTHEAWAALELGRQSKVEVVRKAVEERLERRNR